MLNFRTRSFVSAALLGPSVVLGASVHDASAEGRSSITVETQIDLPGVSSVLEQSVPVTLHRRETAQVCAEPERVCTKVPEFRGLKVTMKNRCVEVTPRIDCTITETVERTGPVSVSGSGSTIILRQDIAGSGTIRGRGEIGKNIRQTVRAMAEFNVAITPELRPDWTLAAETNTDFRWLQRPEFQLFNRFPVSIGSQIEGPLRAGLADFEATIPGMLAELDVRGEAEALWRDLQAPIAISLPSNQKAFLHIRPNQFGFHGLETVGNTLTAGMTIGFDASIDMSPEGPGRLPLPDLTDLLGDGFQLSVPAHIPLQNLSRMVNGVLPARFDDIAVVVTEADFVAAGEILVVNLDIEADGGLLSALNGAVQVRAKPRIDGETQSLVFDEIAIGGVDGQNRLVQSAALSMANAFVSDHLTVRLDSVLETMGAELRSALNGPVGEGFHLSGVGEVGFSDLSLAARKNTLTVTATAKGDLTLRGFEILQ
ncbi:DUF4403 family protein [Roseobacter sp. MH60115]|uniref:DUF4403 family protein n=1 Tax=Roseobacter sp. MH60115 TaxID=2785324 RepID=UPI0018A29542|nr:DUF4403 family protein [Roseobacter sp. MH60115]